MRVRISADSIRNLDRLLAFDEAAGSKGLWSKNTLAAGSGPTRDPKSARPKEKHRDHEDGSGNRHSRVPTAGNMGNSAMIEHY